MRCFLLISRMSFGRTDPVTLSLFRGSSFLQWRSIMSSMWVTLSSWIICLCRSHSDDSSPGPGEDVLHRTPGHPARSPVIIGRVREQIVDVALLGVVEEAVVAPLLWRVIAVVTTSLVILTSFVTFSEGWNRDEVVDSGARTAPMLLVRQWVGGNIEDDR